MRTSHIEMNNFPIWNAYKEGWGGGGGGGWKIFDILRTYYLNASFHIFTKITTLFDFSFNWKSILNWKCIFFEGIRVKVNLHETKNSCGSPFCVHTHAQLKKSILKKKFICKLANRKSLRFATFVSIFRQEFCEPQLKSQPEFRKKVIDRCSNVISEVLSLQWSHCKV